MALIPSTSVKTAMLNTLRGEVANGTLEILSAAGSVLAIFGLDATAGSVTTNVWTLGFDTLTVTGEAIAGVGTTATKARIKDASANIDITEALTVGLVGSGANFKLNIVSISSGQNVTLVGPQTVTY